MNHQAVLDSLQEYFRGDEVTIASEAMDVNGTDYWITNNNGLKIGVDLKEIRNPIKHDAVIELRHEYVDGTIKLGWALLKTRNTNYIAYHFVNQQRGLYLVDFPALRAATERYGAEWERDYYVSRSANPPAPKTKRYDSICVYIPFKILYEKCIEQQRVKYKE